MVSAEKIAERVCPPWVARGGRTWELVIEAVQAAIDATAQAAVGKERGSESCVID
jgi:hypothetical protein